MFCLFVVRSTPEIESLYWSEVADLLAMLSAAFA